MFLFLAAVSLFGTLISQLNEILAASGTFNKMIQSNFEAYLQLRPKYGFVSLYQPRLIEHFGNILCFRKVCICTAREARMHHFFVYSCFLKC